MQKTLNNRVYQAQPETYGCEGCAARGDMQLCNELGLGCSQKRIIWVEVNPATVEGPLTIQTSEGTLQVSSNTQGVCLGCVAEDNRQLCREINNQTPCYVDQHRIWIRFQPVVPDYDEVLCILQEEASEVITAVSKVRRFGLDNHHPDRTTTNKCELEEEVGDLLAMIEILTSTGYLDPKAVHNAQVNKTQKLKEYSQVWTKNTIN